MNSLPPNPFATRFTAPGRIDWIGPAGFLGQLETRWRTCNCRAAIIGAHGSGKSTLLEHLVPRFGEIIWRRDACGQDVTRCNSSKPRPASAKLADQRARRPTVWLQLRKSERLSMDIPWREFSQGCLLVLDGYEQLGRWRRASLLARSWLQDVKLLVTSHRRTLLPTLCELAVTADTARAIIERLTTDRRDLAKIIDDQMDDYLRDHDGNMREVLMNLYDRVEEQREVRLESS